MQSLIRVVLYLLSTGSSSHFAQNTKNKHSHCISELVHVLRQLQASPENMALSGEERFATYPWEDEMKSLTYADFGKKLEEKRNSKPFAHKQAEKDKN